MSTVATETATLPNGTFYADFLAERGGNLYIASHWADQDKPFDRVCYYPIGVRATDYREWVGEQCYSQGDGRYSPRGKPYGYAPTFGLINGGKTLPDKRWYEEVPIPCPKVRKGIDTQWRNGKWEKYLKTRGWVLA